MYGRLRRYAPCNAFASVERRHIESAFASNELSEAPIVDDQVLRDGFVVHADHAHALVAEDHLHRRFPFVRPNQTLAPARLASNGVARF